MASKNELRARGKASLEFAMRRDGGPGAWARRLGVERRHSATGHYWSEKRIEREVGPFLEGRDTWPAEREFLDALPGYLGWE